MDALRETPDATSKPKYYDLTNIPVRRGRPIVVATKSGHGWRGSCGSSSSSSSSSSSILLVDYECIMWYSRLCYSVLLGAGREGWPRVAGEVVSLRPVRLFRAWISEGLTQADSSKGWEFSCLLNLTGSLPESLTQGLLIGKLLIGGLGVPGFRVNGYSIVIDSINIIQLIV